MTTVMFVASDGKTVMQISTVEAIPQVGDIVVTPENTVWKVVQRAFVATVPAIVSLQPKKFAEVTIQCAVVAVEGGH